MRHNVLQPEWKLADPICTFVFSVLVLFTTFTILRDIFAVLMEGNLLIRSLIICFIIPFNGSVELFLIDHK